VRIFNSICSLTFLIWTTCPNLCYIYASIYFQIEDRNRWPARFVISNYTCKRQSYSERMHLTTVRLSARRRRPAGNGRRVIFLLLVRWGHCSPGRDPNPSRGHWLLGNLNPSQCIVRAHACMSFRAHGHGACGHLRLVGRRVGPPIMRHENWQHHYIVCYFVQPSVAENFIIWTV
jgi:hypothetical protein